MKKIIAISAMTAMLFTGCDLFKKDSTIIVNTYKGLNVYLDGEFKATVSGDLKIFLKEGKHKIKVEGTTEDGNWNYLKEQEFEIGGNVEQTILIYPEEKPTPKKQAELDKEEQERQEINKNNMSIAEQNGCANYEVYQQVIQDNDEESIIFEKTMDEVNKYKDKYLSNEKFYFEQNDYVDLVDIELNKDTNSVVMEVRNLKTDTLIEFGTMAIYVYDENYNYIGHYTTDNFVVLDNTLAEGQIFKSSFELSNLDDDELAKKIMMSSRIYFIVTPIELHINDKNGAQSFVYNYLEDNIMKMISTSSINDFIGNHEEFIKELYKKCTKFDSNNTQSNQDINQPEESKNQPND